MFLGLLLSYPSQKVVGSNPSKPVLHSSFPPPSPTCSLYFPQSLISLSPNLLLSLLFLLHTSTFPSLHPHFDSFSLPSSPFSFVLHTLLFLHYSFSLSSVFLLLLFLTSFCLLSLYFFLFTSFFTTFFFGSLLYPLISLSPPSFASTSNSSQLPFFSSPTLFSFFFTFLSSPFSFLASFPSLALSLPPFFPPYLHISFPVSSFTSLHLHFDTLSSPS